VIVLVDTGPLVALCDQRDGFHARATRELDRLAKHRFVVSDAVLAEAHHLLPARPARHRLAAMVARLPMTAWVSDDPEVARADGWAWMARYAEHGPDWADALLVVASSKLKRAAVWTFDSEFRTTWRRLDGTRVPLAIARSK
jgi:predicted nucleic acid-binding protein